MTNFMIFIIGAIFGMAALLLYAYIIDKIDDRKFKKEFDADYIKRLCAKIIN